MINRILPSLIFLPLLGATSALAGSFNQITFSGDATSGLSSALSYTAVADFNGDGTRTINGVAHTDTGTTGTNYTLSGATTTFNTNNNTNVSGVSKQVVTDFVYTGDGTGNATLTLSNLEMGRRYVTTWNSTSFGAALTRRVNITPSDTGVAYEFDQNFSDNPGGLAGGNALRYVFTATAATISYAFDAVSDGDSFHHYAVSNALLTSAGPVLNSVSGTTGADFTPYTVSNNDLLQTNLAGAPVTGGNFAGEGSAQLAALNNGSFVINGNRDSGGFATVTNNAFVEFALDTGTNILGYDVSSIDIYGGWNDSGRDRLLVNISYSTVGTDEWIPYDFLDFDPVAGAAPSAASAIFATSLTGVDGVRFDFPNLQENGYAGIGELDVIGFATVPEPTAGLLAGLSLLGCLSRRRR